MATSAVSNGSTKAKKLRAVLLSYQGPPGIDPIVAALERGGYEIVLYITGRGPNSSIALFAYDSLGPQVQGMVEKYDFPVLCVKNVSSAKPSIFGARPDLVFGYGFPYRITDDLLNSGITFVNLHPAPLPALAGPRPFYWPVMRPDLFPLDDYFCTTHYMASEIDAGDVIKESKCDWPTDPKARENISVNDVLRISISAFEKDLDEIIAHVREKKPGSKQRPLPPGVPPWAARDLTDEERTIKPSMSVVEAKRIWRCRFLKQNPFFKLEGNLFSVMNLTDFSGSPEEAAKVRAKPNGFVRRGTKVLIVFKDDILELELRRF